MAYATVAGLPVAVGLYTAFIPMILYALLGTSRVLSVSSTTTLAILAGTQLGLVVPDGDPARLLTAAATLTAMVGVFLVLAAVLRLGFVANFISTPVLTGFKAGIGLVIVLDQLPKLLGIHIEKAGFFRDVLSVVHHLPRDLAADAGRRRRDAAGAGRHGASLAARPGTAGRRRRCHRRVVAPQPAVEGRVDRRADSAGVPVADDAGCEPGHGSSCQGALGIALMSFTETIAAGRAFAAPADPPIRSNRELLATGVANLGGALTGAMPGGGGTSQTAVVRAAGGRSQKASLVTAGAALATMLLLAPLLGLMPNATLAAVVIVYSVGLIQPAEFRQHPPGSHDGVPLGGRGLPRRAGVRHAEGHPGRHHRVHDRAREPGRAPARVRHRPQARRRRAAAAHARAPGRRDLRGPADPAARGAPVLRQRAGASRTRSARW